MHNMSSKDDEQREFWGDASDYIYDLFTNRPAGKYVLNQMLDSVKRLTGMTPEWRILAVGCAGGTHSLGLAERGFKKLVGIDLSPKAVERANKNASERVTRPPKSSPNVKLRFL